MVIIWTMTFNLDVAFRSDLWDGLFIIIAMIIILISTILRFFLVVHAEGFVKKGGHDLKLFKQLYWLVLHEYQISRKLFEFLQHDQCNLEQLTEQTICRNW